MEDKKRGGLVIFAISLGLLLFPKILLLPVIITQAPLGCALGPLIALISLIFVFDKRKKVTSSDALIFSGCALVWIGGALWNSYAFSQRYNIQIDLLGLIPFMWAALIAPVAYAIQRKS